MITYQVSILRYVHDVRTGEFANIGLAMWVPDERELSFRINEHVTRLSPFFGQFNSVRFRSIVRHVRSALRELAEEAIVDDLFREIPPTIEALLGRAFAMDDPCLVWTPAIFGQVVEPQRRFEALYNQLVLVHPQHEGPHRRDEAAVWSDFHRKLRERGIDNRLQKKVTIASGSFSHTFRIGWQNGVEQVLDVISFDLVDPDDALDKAAKWHGRLDLLSSEPFKFTAILARPRTRTQARQLEAAYRILKDAPNVRDVVSEEEASDFINDIVSDIESHTG